MNAWLLFLKNKSRVMFCCIAFIKYIKITLFASVKLLIEFPTGCREVLLGQFL